MPSFQTTIDVETEFEVFCGKCGAGLCLNSSTRERHGRNCVDVDPCDKCLADEYDRGLGDGGSE